MSWTRRSSEKSRRKCIPLQRTHQAALESVLAASRSELGALSSLESGARFVRIFEALLFYTSVQLELPCLLHWWGITTWKGWEFATVSHRCINRQKLLYRRSENVKIACKKRASGSFSFHVNFISLNDAVASLLIRTIIKVSDPNCTPFFSPISQPRGSSPQKNRNT